MRPHMPMLADWTTGPPPLSLSLSLSHGRQWSCMDAAAMLDLSVDLSDDPPLL